MSIHFCTFGSSGYEKALERIQTQALNSSFFTTIDIYNEKNTPGLDKHSKFIETHKRGYGYWIWKPMVILDMMSRYEKDSIIIFADAGCEIIKNEVTTEIFNKYIKDVKSHPSHILGFVNSYIENHYTKQDLFNYMNANESNYTETNQLCAGIQIVVNTEQTKKLMQEWLDILVTDNYHFVDDSPSIAKNSLNFKEHRHDQSVMSLLKKKYGFCPQEYGTIINTIKIPIHPSRKRTC
jgi:hypothetical protein